MKHRNWTAFVSDLIEGGLSNDWYDDLKENYHRLERGEPTHWTTDIPNAYKLIMEDEFKDD